MNVKTLAALAIGLSIGIATSFVARQSRVEAAEATAKWEYKAVYLVETAGSPPDLDAVNRGGYEFVSIAATGGKDAGSIAVFRRPAK